MAPALALAYERVLGNPQVASTGDLYGFGVTQYSAFDSHDLFKAGTGLTAQRGSLSIKAGVNGVIGDGAKSTGVGANLVIGYRP